MKNNSLIRESTGMIHKGMLFLASLLVSSASFASEPINVAGVYECDAKPNGVRKQMYLTLDFINGTPDFTQVFTEKESSFKRLPKDFMNAKKLSRSFGGSTAPGFGKFREKYLFANTDEFRLTNPRIEDGIIIADWTTDRGEKGECQIIVNEDRSLRILGLTKLSRELSPDDIEIGLVEDRLPQGVTPFVSPKEAVDFVMGEYEKSRVTPKVTTFDPEIITEVVRAEQKGSQIEVKLRMKNMSKYDALSIVVAEQGQDKTYAEAKDGTMLRSFRPQTPGTVGDKPAVRAKKGEWVNFSIIFDGVDKKVDYLSNLKFDNYLAGGFFMNNHITTIENLPVFQTRTKAPVKTSAKASGEGIRLNFEVYAPTWTAVATTASDKGINIRKTPSSSAARPLVDELKINNYQISVKYFAEWSTATPKGNVYALMFEPGQYAPVLKEQTGWYELMGIGPKGGDGWVSAQYCRKYDLQPLTKEDLTGYGYKVYGTGAGVYAVKAEYDEMDSYATLSIGKLSNCILVIPYLLNMDVTVGNEWKVIKGTEGYVLQAAKKDCDQYGTPDMSRLPQSVIEDVMSKLEKMQSPSYLCKANGEYVFVQ
ncbi:MAG: hypothetical protein HDR47_07170 [Bacteroides sp.]|nr:hypothetical protein [Bacteroides sp.]